MKKIKEKLIVIISVCLLSLAFVFPVFADYSSDVIDLRPDYKGATEGILLGKDYLNNPHITDLDEDYQAWMQLATGDYFTEEYLHQYQVYWKCVEAGFIEAGDDLDLSKVIKEDDGSGQKEEAPVTVDHFESSMIEIPEEYTGLTEGVLSGSEYAIIDGIDENSEYQNWMKMEYGSHFTKDFLDQYKVYRAAVNSGIINAGEDLDLGKVFDTTVYSDGTREISEAAQALKDEMEIARFQAMKTPTLIICIVLVIVISIVSVIWMRNGTQKKYKLSQDNKTEVAK